MDVNEIKFRCSSLGHIMTEPPKGKTGLSQTAKTHCVDVFTSWKYNRFTEINSKYFEKGNEVEEDSITTVSRITKKFFLKNVEHLENEFIKGTPDLYIGESITKAQIVRDTKSPWDIYTFQRAKSKGLDNMYHWQVTGYIALSGAEIGHIDYCLNNTPYHIVEGELRKESYRHPEGNTPAWIELQIINNHVYDRDTFEEYVNIRGCFPIDENSNAVVKGFVEIPLEERYFCFDINRNEEDIEKIYSRVIECREYIKKELLK